jgi:uncharacterized phiE125 gp8 family phage protein
MLKGDPILLPAAASDEAKAYLRIEGEGENALVGRLMTGAAELCERFVRQTLLTRAFDETIGPSSAWRRLGACPVLAISSVESIAEDGAAAPLAADAYAIDIDAEGQGWVRVKDAFGASRIRVRYQAGMAADWAGLPDALRQGMIRLTAHLFTHRDAAEDGGPPAAVTALWRPWRRMRLR